jgi:hypothetical protein
MPLLCFVTRLRRPPISAFGGLEMAALPWAMMRLLWLLGNSHRMFPSMPIPSRLRKRFDDERRYAADQDG